MDNKPLARFRRAVYAVSSLLVIVLFIAIPTGFGLLNLGWATSFVSIILLLVLFLLNWHSDFAVQFLQRLKLDLLVPAFKEVINHQKNLYQCRLVVRNMEYTLGFYRLWEMVQFGENNLPAIDEAPSKLKRWLKKWQAALRWQRLSEWLQKDPLVKEPALPAGIAHELLTAVTDLEKIISCAEATANHLRQQRKNKEHQPVSTDIRAGNNVQIMLEKHQWATVLQLLYQEQHGPAPRVLWGEIKTNGQLIDDLAALLVWSGQLPVPEPDLPYTEKDLTALLPTLETYSLSEVRSSIFADQERQRQNRVVVDRLSYMLDYFHLYPQMGQRSTQSLNSTLLIDQVQPPYCVTDTTGKSSLSPTLRRLLINSLVGSSEDERLLTCTGHVAYCFGDPQPAFMDKILCLLYRELYGPLEAEHTLWVSNKRNADFVAGLSQFLLAGGNLPDKEIEEPYQTEELARLLMKLENFSFEHIKNVIAADQKKRFKIRFEISRLEHTLNFYRLFTMFDEQQVEWNAHASSSMFKRSFQDALVEQALQSRHEPGDDAWITDFLSGLRPVILLNQLIGVLNWNTALHGVQLPAGVSDQPVQTVEITNPTEPIEAFISSVELLYREQHGLPTRVTWGELLHQQQEILSLAQLLLASQRLPSGDGDLPYGALELYELIKSLDAFELDHVRAIVQADLERRRQNRDAMERLMAVLHYFNLYPLLSEVERNGGESLSKVFRRQLIDLPPAFASEEERITDLTKRFAQHMQLDRLQQRLPKQHSADLKISSVGQASPTFSAEAAHLQGLLSLLYWKYYKGETQVYWQTGKQNSTFINMLAVVLLHSQLLPEHESYFPYTLVDLEYILVRLSNFELAEIEDQLDRLNEIWQYALGYQEFLTKNNIPCPDPNCHDILTNVQIPLAAGNVLEAVQNFLIWQGQEALVERYRGTKDLKDITDYNESERCYQADEIDLSHPESAELLHCLGLVSLIIFVTEKVTESLRLREHPCQLAASHEKMLLIASAYLEFKKYLRNEYKIEGKDFISVDYIARTWAETITKNQPKPIGYHTELITIRDILRKGEWPQQIPVVLEETLENIGQQHQEINQKLDELASQSSVMRKVIEAAFRKLTTPTVERYLDAHRQTAYLMAIRVESGTLASLLDLLIQKDEDKLRKLGEDLKIEFFIKTTGRRKYNFGQFCPFARIGVVPTGMAFDAFFEMFQADFEKIVDARKQLLSTAELSRNLDLLSNVEVIVSRFGLAGQNYFAFQKEGITHPRAIEKIRELLPYELEVTDMSQVIEYQEENILKFVLQLPVKELVACHMTLTNDESALLERDELIFKEALLKAQGFIAMEDLARAYQSPSIRRDAELQLGQLISSSLIKTEVKRCQVMAKAYIDTLMVFGAMI